MSSVTIYYSSLRNLQQRSNAAVDRLNSYARDLEKSVIPRMNSLTGGKNANINNSEYYTRAKVNLIKNKSDRLSRFSASVGSFIEFAREKDKNVARRLDNNSKDFKNSHDYIKDNWWTRLQGWLIELKNSCPLFEAIGDLINGIKTVIDDAVRNIRHWYQCGGGKELAEIFFAVADIMISLVLMACTILFPATYMIFTVCAIIGAAIGLLNSFANLGTSIQAKCAHDKGDPAWAKVYSDRDTLSQVFREVRWSGNLKFLNKPSYFIANALDAVKFICDAVGIIESLLRINSLLKTFDSLHRASGVSRGKIAVKYVSKGDYRKWIQKYSDPGKMKELSDLAKKAKNIQKTTKSIKSVIGYIKKDINYRAGGDHSFSKFCKDYSDIFKDFMTDRFKSLSLLDKIKNNIIKKDFSNIKKFGNPVNYDDYIKSHFLTSVT